MFLLKTEHEGEKKLIQLEFFKEYGSLKSGGKTDTVTHCPSVTGLIPSSSLEPDLASPATWGVNYIKFSVGLFRFYFSFII